MKQGLLILFLISIFQLNAQKKMEQIIDGKNISSISIEGNQMFKIKVSTSKSKSIILKSKIEGEYNEHIVVLARIKENLLVISSAFQPLFENDNDKLSAHKVISIEVELIVPERLIVYIKSNIASARIKGKYKFLTLELMQGNAALKNFFGDAIINSLNGDVAIETDYVTVETTSKKGKIKKEALATGTNTIKINTINGNINVTKTRK